MHIRSSSRLEPGYSRVPRSRERSGPTHTHGQRSKSRVLHIFRIIFTRGPRPVPFVLNPGCESAAARETFIIPEKRAPKPGLGSAKRLFRRCTFADYFPVLLLIGDWRFSFLSLGARAGLAWFDKRLAVFVFRELESLSFNVF